VNYLTLVVKNLDKKTLRELKVQAARRGLTLSQVLEEALSVWLNRFQDAATGTEMDRNNDFYESKRLELESEYKGKYLLVANGGLLGAYGSLDEAAQAIKSLTPRPVHAILTKAGEELEEQGEWLGGSLER
jgi:plasmid stability protein